jgi:hypothetical protein
LSKFKSFSIIEHIYLGLFVWFFAFIINTLFSIVNPEDAAPYTYLLATISGLIFLIKRSPKQRFGPNIVIFIITVLLMLDESAYGTEVFNIEPIYWKRYDYYVYDLHNLIKGLFEILNFELNRADWDFGMFDRFMKMDIVIIGLLLLYLIIYRLWIRKKTEKDQIQQIAINLASIFLIGYAFFSIYQMMSLPADPKNVWLFGYSKKRIILLISICIYIGFLVAIYFNMINSKMKIIRFLTHIMDSSGPKILMWVSLGLGLLIIAIYQFILPFTPFPDYKAVFPRMTPFVYLIAVSLAFLSFVLINWDGIFIRPLSSYKNRFLYFLKRYPGYIYLGFVVIQIFISTLIDQHLISLEFIVWKLNKWSLSIWVEESFEMIASFELVLAGATYRFNNFSSIEGVQNEKDE